MTKIQVAMALFLRCVGIIALIHGVMGFAFKEIAKMTLDKSDPSLIYVNGQLITGSLFMIYGLVLIILAKPLVIFLSKGLKENES